MEMIFGAIALVVAAPVAAQAPNPHAGHAQHQQAPAGQGEQGDKGHREHKDCCKMVDGKMECQMMKAHKDGAHQDDSRH
jgi:hypothetical protein